MSENESNGAPPLSTIGLKDTDSVTVYDPKTHGLKLATGAQAKALAAQGFKIGPEAEYEAKKNDGLSQVGTFLTHAGNTGSFGLLNGGLAALGRRGDLINEQAAEKANEGSALAGDLTGIGAQMYAQGVATAGTAVGGLGSRLLAGSKLAKVGQSAAEGGLYKNLAKQAINSATTGLGQAAVMGISNEAVQDTVMKAPITAEKLAQAAFTDIVWNAAINVGIHGAISMPKLLRNGGGNLLERFEQMGWLEREMVKKPVVPGTEPVMTGFTVKQKHTTTSGSSAETNVRDFERNLSDERLKTDASIKAEDKSAFSNKTDATEKGASSYKQTTTEQKMAEDAAGTEPLPKDAVADQRWGFEWDGHSKEEKLQTLRDMVKYHTRAVPENLAIWDEMAANEKLITRLNKEIEEGRDIVKNHKEINRLIQEKEAAKELLSDAHPRDVQADGMVVPGFRDINDEYARVMGKTPLSDIKKPKFGVKVPEVKGSKGKPIKTSTTESESNAFSNRETNTESGSETTAESFRRQTDERNVNETIRDDKYKGKTNESETHTEEYTHRYKIPKPAAEFEKGKYKMPFEPRAIGIIGAGSHYAGPLAPVGYTIASGMTAANTVAYTANYRKPLGEFFEKYGTKLAKTVALPTAAAGRAYLEKRKRETPRTYDLQHYEAASAAVNHAATNPEAVQAYIEKKYPGVSEAHPETMGQVFATVMRGVHALDQAQVKKPYAPTLQQQTFKPPRAQQVKFMRAWRTLSNTDEALDDADPQTMEMLKTVFPAWHDTATKELMHKVQTAKSPIRGRIARQVSSFTGAQVRPIDDAATLKRLQETAGPAPKPEAGQPQNGNPKSTGGAKSAKITQAAVSADATSFQQKEMGL